MNAPSSQEKNNNDNDHNSDEIEPFLDESVDSEKEQSKNVSSEQADHSAGGAENIGEDEGSIREQVEGGSKTTEEATEETEATEDSDEIRNTVPVDVDRFVVDVEKQESNVSAIAEDDYRRSPRDGEGEEEEKERDEEQAEEEEEEQHEKQRRRVTFMQDTEHVGVTFMEDSELVDESQREPLRVSISTSQSKKREKAHPPHSFYLVEQNDLLPYYTPPQQLHKWGEKQGHLHTNWGDIFCDLFFVSAAYNLGNQLRYHPNGKGLLYFLGCLLPLQTIWQYKMYFGARYKQRDDVFHRVYESFVLLSLGMAVLHIRPVLRMADLAHYYNMFAFALSITILNCLYFGRALEVFLFVDGTGAARNNAKHDMYWVLSSIVVSVPAAVYSGIQFYSEELGKGSGYDSGDSYTGSSYNDAVASGSYDGGHNTTYDDRFLAGDSSSSSYGSGSSGGGSSDGDDIAIYLMCISWISSQIVFLYQAINVYTNRRNMIPLNINYCIHRYGEWTMLTLGEGILSLLIVDVRENSDFYMTFYSGIITITLLQFIHFRSQPHDPDKHAMRRKVKEVYLFITFSQIYTGALIILGASYKMYAYRFYAGASYGGAHRRDLFSVINRRFLAGGGGASYDISSSIDDLDQNIAYFFCGSMAVLYLCTDLIMLTHNGWELIKVRVEKCTKEPYNSVRGVPAAVVFITARLLLIILVAGLGLYVKRSRDVAIIALFTTFSELILRFVGEHVFPDTDDVNKSARVKLNFYIEDQSIHWSNVSLKDASSRSIEQQQLSSAFFSF